MELLPQNTYMILKSLKKKDLLENAIILKYGETASERLYELLGKKYIIRSSAVDSWGKPTEPIKYAITEDGLRYLEDHDSITHDEKWEALKNSVIVPIIVSVISSLLINGISLLLQWT